MAASYNPIDGKIYTGRRGSSSDGLYRLEFNGFIVKLSSGSNVAAVVVDPVTGDVFFSEDYGGSIFRTAFGTSGRTTWVSGLHGGDDDPVGMAIAPLGYTGTLLPPGEALVVDRGNNGADEIWRWSPTVAQGETALHTDTGILVDALDVAIDASTVFVVDSGSGAVGTLYTIAPDSALVPFPTSVPILNPAGIVIDPLDGDLLVYDQGVDPGIVRVDRSTGAVSDVLSGLSTGIGWAGIDLSPNGRLMLVTDQVLDSIHVLGLCDATGDPAADCDETGVYDLCEIVQGLSPDCNDNGLPDGCDLSDGVSLDCNLDGVPDECPICPPVEVVFIMDTSTSMNDEAAALCGDLHAVITRLEAAGLQVMPQLLAICDLPGGAYDCLTDRIDLSLGTTVPGLPPAGIETLGACPGGNEVCLEDWGRATAVVAGRYGWQPEGESVRVVVPVSDEGPWCGDPVSTLDTSSIDHAIVVAQSTGVIVSPITGTGSSSAVINLAQAIADSTGGQRFSSSAPTTDIAEGIVDIVFDACRTYSDCNDNQILDECDISQGTSLDENEDGVPDECATATNAPLRSETGFWLSSYPNPFNPRTTISYSIPKAGYVELAVYDLAGRHVRTLVKEHVAMGEHHVRWNGEDSTGSQVASGVYLYQLRAGGFVETKRMVLLK
jgi:hypothetical protein